MVPATRRRYDTWRLTLQGKKGSVKEIATPKLEDNDVLIKVEYAAQVRMPVRPPPLSSCVLSPRAGAARSTNPCFL